ncbi:AcrR family transcriptional regulator [Kibdelosporangium banguiense]|uniref:AcrR family transcriptional regulator n=1 Tax=Kibdelosporangium banguiense TaxID=1365924 RepID=A0ABS4TPB9_9PSEU|nr:TetR/AcrR family transcriptional regulator [Kibdelosporangium banguiense]MBP2326234.1 AcrR family transcriptional regulator [Kibdelosporangium banguiense]
MDTRTRILQAAADLLSRSSEADFSTRAVCEAAGVGAPALYRQFGDKDGLLAAVVDLGFEKYLASKRAAGPSHDPVQDLRDGWDNHVSFAVLNPNYYRLLYSLATPPKAAAEAHQLLVDVLERCAAAGRLKVSTRIAAQMVMAANAGVALSLITRPGIYTDPDFSTRVRDSVHAAILTDAPATRPEPIAATARTLGAQLRQDPPETLTEPEIGLLQQWLTQLS